MVQFRVYNDSDQDVDLDIYANTPFWQRVNVWQNLKPGQWAEWDCANWNYRLHVYCPTRSNPEKLQQWTGVPCIWKITGRGENGLRVQGYADNFVGQQLSNLIQAGNLVVPQELTAQVEALKVAKVAE